MSNLDIRMYYEDTDHGGVVYHANYLKFMERGRTEYLRNLGFEQSELAKSEDVLFALSRSDIRYHSPAKFDDLITVKTEVTGAKGARINFFQGIYRDQKLLVVGDILIACMSKSGKPKRIPAFILDGMKKELS
ncbi:MAG: tol-pal system-associated acyl-CoA thioesterase [Ghiorsea sp.]